MFEFIKKFFKKKPKVKIDWSKKKKSTAYAFKNADAGIEYFERVMKRKAETPKEKEAILMEMAEEGKVISIHSSDLPLKEFIQDLSKKYGKTLYVGPKKKEEIDEQKLKGNESSEGESNV